MSNSYVFDIEGNGLSPTKIWCLSYCKAGTDNIINLTNYGDMKNFLLQDNISLIAHNCVSFDIPILERILGIKIPARIVDTLGLSWYLSPKRVKHGLESYGEEYGVPKPVVKEEEWLGLSKGELDRIDYLKSNSPDSEELSILEKKKKDHLSLMIHRCSEDVKINSRLYSDQMKKLGMLYDDMDGINRLINYIYFKLSCAREQEEVKWKLDLDKVNSGLEELESIKQEKVEALRLAMPKQALYKEKKRPKIYTKKDGSKSKKALEWEAFCEENGFDKEKPSHKFVYDYEIGNPGSSTQVKSWLYSLGWKPETFSFVRDKESFNTRKIPQVNIPNGGGICPSIKKLYDKEPNLELLEGLSVISHRISILKGFLKAVDDNGYVYAGISGLTNTMRFKHSICVNLPGVDKPYGELIRGCLIAPEGYELCGSDLCSLEDRTKQHFMWEYDPEYVKEMIKPGFDPHLDLALAANALTPEQIENHKSGNEDHSKVRKVYKSANYACVYGAGATTVARSAGITKNEATKLIDAYWKRNWSVKKIAENTKDKVLWDGSRWLYNPISHLWYSLRSEKDKFSTLNQGTGTYCFDMWVRIVREKFGRKIVGQFHDEIITLTSTNDRESCKNDLEQAISMVNQELKLNRELEIDVQFGDSYADIH